MLYEVICMKDDIGAKSNRTTVCLKTTTKDKLDRNRAPGQCYDGFIWQLLDFWENTGADKRDSAN